MHPEVPIIGGHFYDLNDLDELLTATSVFDQVRDTADPESVFAGKLQELRQPCHGAIIVHDFTNHGDGTTTRHACQVQGGLRMTSSLQNPT